MHPFLPDIETLSLPAQIAQMVVVRASGYLFDQQIRYPQWEPPEETLRHWIGTVGIGGVILLGGSAVEVALRTQQLQEWATIPLLMTADVEEGVGQRFPGATWFPPPMTLAALFDADPSLAEDAAAAMGAVTAEEAQAIGLNWLLAPVVDVNNNPDNPVINVRAFGDRPAVVSALAAAFIRGAQSYPVLTCAKHFPGHGDTAVDSHLALPVLLHSLERLQAVELPPFQTAIAAGVDAVMTAHLQIPALDAALPATLSQPILTGLLRQQMGFEGLIVTDALIMGALTEFADGADAHGGSDVAVLAVEAGADIVLMPADPVSAIQALCAAVDAGRISAARIRESVERIWAAKRKVCAPDLTDGTTAHAWEAVSPVVQPQRLTAALSQPAAVAQVDRIVQTSQRTYFPALSRLNAVTEPGQCRNLIILDDALDGKILAQFTPAIALPKQKGYALQLIDRHTPAIDFVAYTKHWQPTLMQLFIRGNPFRGSAGLTHTAQAWLQHLVQSEQLQALVIYGSPYVLETFLPILPPDVPYLFTYGQMPQAQAIALNTLFSAP